MVDATLIDFINDTQATEKKTQVKEKATTNTARLKQSPPLVNNPVRKKSFVSGRDPNPRRS